MNGRVAKRKRREARESGIIVRKQFFKPLLVPMPSGKVDPETGEFEMVETYIPRRERRKIMRTFLTKVRKGKINAGQ